MAPEIFIALERSLLEKLAGLQKLNRLADQHREALVANDVDTIVHLNEEQTKELSHLDRLQRSSSKLLARVAAGLGLEEQGLSLKSIAPALPEAQRQRLESLSTDLTDEAARLAMASELNANLSANALEFIRFTLQAVSNSVQQRSQTGSADPASLVLDTRA
ncbi:MAG: flagellar export chaperone FlgN [Armatimonadetes bacterium]|nr:flagellar export chaperone FlgN [Armatimonadota bacterium]